jgi:hypothetical protein
MPKSGSCMMKGMPESAAVVNAGFAVIFSEF